MKQRLIIFLLFTFFVCKNNHAQNPGGVTNNLQFWLKSWDSTYFTFQSGKVKEWMNSKSSGYKLTAASSGQRPTLYNGSSSGSSVDSLNYQPHLTFDASVNAYLTNSTTSPDMLGTAGTIIIVSNSDRGNNRSGVTYYSNTLYRYQVKPKLWVQTNDAVTAVNNSSPGYVSHPNYPSSSGYASPANNARIVVSRGFGKNLKGRINATQPTSLRYDSIAGYCPGIAAGVFVGGNPTNSEYFDGKIAELIFYNTTLADDSVRSIESSLAIKYGVTLDPGGLDATKGYVNTSGTSIYAKNSDGTTLWNYVIGLGRDDNSGVYQKQSHQYDDSVRIYTSTLATRNAVNTATISNNTFLMAGSTSSTYWLADRSTSSYASQKPSSVSLRMDREWKVVNTGFTNTYTMTFKLNGSANTMWSDGTGVLTLLVGNSSDLTTATSVSSGSNGITISYSSGVITVSINPAHGSAALPANSTKYITPAVTSATLPVHILNFNAYKYGNAVKLVWNTNSSEQTAYFKIQKSYDNSKWEDITEVKAFDNNQSYELLDSKTENKTFIYYRVVEHRKDGKVLYSLVRQVKLASQGITISVFPNPSKEKVRVSWGLVSKPQAIWVVNSAGSNVKAPVLLYQNYADIDVSNLPKGIYVISIVNNNITSNTKLVKE